MGAALAVESAGRWHLIAAGLVVDCGPGDDGLAKAADLAARVAAARARIGGPDDPWLGARVKASRFFDRWEAAAVASIAGVYERAERVALDRLRQSKTRRGTHLWTRDDGSAIGDYAMKAVDADDLFDEARWGRELEDDALRWLLALENEAGAATATQIGVGFTEGDPGLARLVAQRAGKVGGTSDTTLGLLRGQLRIAAGRGETIDEVAARIENVFASARGARARVIARTEVVGAANEANVTVARESGVVKMKQWLATLDDRTRDTHAAADGQEVGLDESFLVGSSELDHPGDYNGDAAETINCRCTMLFTVSTTAAPDAATVDPTADPLTPSEQQRVALARSLDEALAGFAAD